MKNNNIFTLPLDLNKIISNKSTYDLNLIILLKLNNKFINSISSFRNLEKKWILLKNNIKTD
jgi:hypothetical protein